MKLLILKSNIKAGLDGVGWGISKNQNLPILKNILIKTDDGIINLISTNLEIAVKYRLPGKIIESGGLTVSFGVLASVINGLDTERINLETNNNNLVINTDNFEATIPGIKEEDFPIIPKLKNSNEYLEVNQGVLKDAISKVIDAASINETKPEIGGVLIDYSNNHLKFAATDSFRLAEKIVFKPDFKSNINGDFKIIIPLGTAQELIRVAKEDDLLKIYPDPNQILFASEEFEITSRLIEGTFPDYQSIIPQNTCAEIIIPKTQIINALKLTGIFSGRMSAVNLEFKNNKTLQVSASEAGVGENRYLIPVKSKGEAAPISFNWRYLTDGVKNQNSEDVFFGIGADSKPSIIKSVGDSSYFYVLMPLKS